MTLFSITQTVAFALLFLLLVFIPMENVFPAKPGQKILRPDWLLDFCFFLGQYIFWNSLVIGLLTHFSYALDDVVPVSFRKAVASQPWLLQAFEVIVLSDFIIYWGHRLQHKVGFLWRFHKIHHTAEHLDWLASHREHPLDSIFTIGLINLPVFVFGFPLETLAWLVAFRGIWAIYIHSNVRISHGPVRLFIGAPELHHWHHTLDRDAGNYANISPLMDKLFGTYYCPDHEPEAFGIREKMPQHYVAQMLYPLLPDGAANAIENKFGKLKKRLRFRKQITAEK